MRYYRPDSKAWLVFRVGWSWRTRHCARPVTIFCATSEMREFRSNRAAESAIFGSHHQSCKRPGGYNGWSMWLWWKQTRRWNHPNVLVWFSFHQLVECIGDVSRGNLYCFVCRPGVPLARKIPDGFPASRPWSMRSSAFGILLNRPSILVRQMVQCDCVRHRTGWAFEAVPNELGDYTGTRSKVWRIQGISRKFGKFPVNNWVASLEKPIRRPGYRATGPERRSCLYRALQGRHYGGPSQKSLQLLAPLVRHSQGG